MKNIVFIYIASETGIEGLKKSWGTLMKGKENSPGMFDMYVTEEEFLKKKGNK